MNPTDPSAPPPPRSNRTGNLVIGVLVAGILGAAVVNGVVDARRARLVRSGNPAPAFVMQRLGGGTLTLGELQGKVVMLDFWATWCGPCVAEMPALVKLAAEYEPKGLAFVAASQDDPGSWREEVSEFAREKAPGLEKYATYPTGRTAAEYQVRSLPTLYFIGRDGRIIEARSGQLSESTLRGMIEDALEQGSAPPES